jgi:ankyrin repeat protein
VKLLLKHGADVNARDNTLRSSLHLAEYGGDLEVAQMLVQHQADVNSRDINGKPRCTPRCTYCSKDNVHSHAWVHNFNENDVLNHVRFLFEHGAEVNRRDANNQTPLHLALGRVRSKLARILLEYGADAKAESDDGKTPLHLLLESRRHDGDALDLIWLLLEHGAEVNRRDKDKQTPLHLAMRRDWSNLALIFLERGGDANVENKNGKTPLHLLIDSEDNMTPSHLQPDFDPVLIAQALLDHGANVNAGNNVGETSLYQELEGDYYIQYDSLGMTQRLTRWRRRARTK